MRDEVLERAIELTSSTTPIHRGDISIYSVGSCSPPYDEGHEHEHDADELLVATATKTATSHKTGEPKFRKTLREYPEFSAFHRREPEAGLE